MRCVQFASLLLAPFYKQGASLARVGGARSVFRGVVAPPAAPMQCSAQRGVGLTHQACMGSHVELEYLSQLAEGWQQRRGGGLHSDWQEAHSAAAVHTGACSRFKPRCGCYAMPSRMAGGWQGEG
jgi:hypothetical protein